MTTYALIAGAVALIGYDPVVRLIAQWRKPRKPTRDDAAKPSSPTRQEAFAAAEVLVSYYRGVNHTAAADAANAAAQMLFVEPPKG